MTVRIALGQVASPFVDASLSERSGEPLGKLGPDACERGIQKCFSMMEKAAEQAAQIICFPEMSCLPFFPQYVTKKEFFRWAESMTGPTLVSFQAKAKELGLVTIINLYEKTSPGEYYDCSPVIDADGTLLGISRMMHIAESTVFHEKFYYKPGNTDYPVFQTKSGARFGFAICYDGSFPEQIRILTLKGAQLILRPTANQQTRLKDSESAIVKFSKVMVDQVNSRLNGVFMAVANRVGIDGGMNFRGGSFITNPKGEVIAQASKEQEELLIADLDLELIDEVRNTYYYLRDRRQETYATICSANIEKGNFSHSES